MLNESKLKEHIYIVGIKTNSVFLNLTSFVTTFSTYSQNYNGVSKLFINQGLDYVDMCM